MAEDFRARAEAQSEAFRARYGVQGAWPDSTLDRALNDHGLPSLLELPDDPPTEVPVGFDLKYLVPGRLWQRERAGHLLAHVIMHGGRRCRSCRTW